MASDGVESGAGKRSADRAEPLARLAAAAASGDRGAFAHLHRRLNPGLLRFFVPRLGGRVEEAEDLSQRTWASVWRVLEAGRYDPGRGAITTFVYAVGYRMWLQHARSSPGARPSAGATDELVQAWLGTEEDPARLAEFTELLDAVRGALAGTGAACLSAEERRVLRAFADGEPDRSLAAKLGVAASTVHARRTGALAKLRAMLAARGLGGTGPSARVGARE